MPTLRASTARLLDTCSHQPSRDVEEEVVDDVDARRRQRRVERVLRVARQPRLDGADLVVRRRRARGDLLGERAHACRRLGRRRVPVAYLARNLLALRRRAGRPRSARLLRLVTVYTALLAEAAVRPSRCRRARPMSELVGLDLDGARRREHELREPGLDAERLADLRAVQRADVVRDRGSSSDVSPDRGRRCRRSSSVRDQLSARRTCRTPRPARTPARARRP